MTLKLPIFLVVTGDQPADPDAPSTAEIATVVGDFGTGPVAANIFTDRALAERLALAMPPQEDGPWHLKTLATETDVRHYVELTSKRHPDWKWVIDDPRLPSDPPGTSTYAETAAVLEALAAA